MGTARSIGAMPCRHGIGWNSPIVSGCGADMLSCWHSCQMDVALWSLTGWAIRSSGLVKWSQWVLLINILMVLYCPDCAVSVSLRSSPNNVHVVSDFCRLRGFFPLVDPNKYPPPPSQTHRFPGLFFFFHVWWEQTFLLHYLLNKLKKKPHRPPPPARVSNGPPLIQWHC